ncbi:hypothetical protein FB45DRAFT_1041407 [Roridomyces roridus]|uniref:Uncharacterized protein n=1 Tax=Roridomyces roridus TaxID=1738132 RepID=A0AAD7F912_9AGAR|nr:hypothetical protein FB45DRAFT_1041407 [Roridomyces roridus]
MLHRFFAAQAGFSGHLQLREKVPGDCRFDHGNRMGACERRASNPSYLCSTRHVRSALSVLSKYCYDDEVSVIEQGNDLHVFETEMLVELWSHTPSTARPSFPLQLAPVNPDEPLELRFVGCDTISVCVPPQSVPHVYPAPRIPVPLNTTTTASRACHRPLPALGLLSLARLPVSQRFRFALLDRHITPAAPPASIGTQVMPTSCPQRTGAGITRRGCLSLLAVLFWRGEAFGSEAPWRLHRSFRLAATCFWSAGECD